MRQPKTISLIDKASSQVFTADYSSNQSITDVRIISLENHVGEDGDLSEIFRLTANGTIEKIPEFKVLQINRVLHIPHAIKAWHLHYLQDEVWYVAPSQQLFVGLWDIRKNSATANNTMRITLGGSQSSLLFIPRGVAHGSANFMTASVDLYSILNQLFNQKQPDEMRLPWDAIGSTFWQPMRD